MKLVTKVFGAALKTSLQLPWSLVAVMEDTYLLKTLTKYLLSHSKTMDGAMQVKVASFETCFISMAHLLTACVLLLSFTTARWLVSADSSPSVMQTTGKHDNLLATRAITGRFSAHHPLCNYISH